MAVITLSSDLGLKDHYLATVKGRILTHCPNARLVDVSHDIAPFDLNEAAYILSNSWRHFPEQTIHWMGINVSSASRFLIAVHKGHYFVGADDGLFSLAFNGYPEFIFALRENIAERYKISGLHAETIAAVCHLALGHNVLEIADQARSMESRIAIQPPASDSFIRASVQHIDSFGNAILNLRQDEFLQHAKSRRFELQFKRERINSLSRAYNDVPPGEKLCMFNSAGMLEIAINRGDASGLLGLKVNDQVIIEFND